MNALGSAKPSAAEISPTRRSLSKRSCAAFEPHFVGQARESDAERIEPMGERARVKTESAADAVARQRPGADPRAQHRLDRGDEVAFRIGDGFHQQWG